MTVSVTNNFLQNARGLTFKDTSSVTWAINPSTNEVSAVAVAGGIISPANPTAVVGLAAVNGSALTFMRSDAAPALNETIAPTWTGTHTFNKAGVSAAFKNTFTVTGNAGLATAYGSTIAFTAGESGSISRIRFGDGSGWSFALSKRTASTDTDLFKFTDGGVLTVKGALGWNGVAAPAQVTGFGTPTGASVIANFPGASATLAQCSAAIAEILTIMKAHGMIGA